MTRRDAILNRLGALERAAGVKTQDERQRALLASLSFEQLEELEGLLSGAIDLDPGESLAAAISRVVGSGVRRRT